MRPGSQDAYSRSARSASKQQRLRSVSMPWRNVLFCNYLTSILKSELTSDLLKVLVRPPGRVTS